MKIINPATEELIKEVKEDNVLTEKKVGIVESGSGKMQEFH